MEEQLNKKNITSEILGLDNEVDFDLDTCTEEEHTEAVPVDPTADNAIVNIIDLFITTSPAILAKYGYPSPDMTIWEEWAKPNLNVAFNHYVPAGTMAGGAVTMPVIAGVIGVAAIGVAFLPVILAHLDKKKAAAAEVLEEEVIVEPSPVIKAASTTEVSDHVLSVSERMSQMEEQVV